MSELDIEPEIDRPETSTQADVTLIARGVTVTARVEKSEPHVLVVVPAGEGTAWKTSVKRGDKVEIYWVGGNEERTLKGSINEVELEDDDEPRWYVAVSGRAERSQRRRAVRAPVEAPVEIPWLDGQLKGLTLDLAEAGMRALLDGWGLPPVAGTRIQIQLTLEEDLLDLDGEVVWHVEKAGGQWMMAVRFVDIAERDADRLRKRVFQALREERARALG
jgi:c-di-GMP-binding flagellar brake protein YcgR